jgi:uncharacterized protein
LVRVVLDTNVLVSAFLTKGKSRSLVLRLIEAHEVILSSQMLAELTDVLSREKFHVANTQIDRFISIIVRKATVVSIHSNAKIVLDDPDDDVVLNTALSGKAQYIVSGDRHLLKIARYENIQVLSVNEFAQMVAKK